MTQSYLSLGLTHSSREPEGVTPPKMAVALALSRQSGCPLPRHALVSSQSTPCLL